MHSISRDLEQHADHLQRIAIKSEKLRIQLETIRQKLADANEWRKVVEK